MIMIKKCNYKLILIIVINCFTLIIYSQSNIPQFFTDIKISNFVAEFNNYQKVELINRPTVSYQIGIGAAKKYKEYVFIAVSNIGLEQIAFKIRYIGNKLSYNHKVLYPNFNQLFSLGLLLNQNTSIHFNYRLCFNGGVAISNGYPDTIPNLEANITFTKESNFFDNRLGIQINKLLKKRIYAIYFNCEASLKQREIILQFNNNYFSETKSYAISYQVISFNVGFIIDNLFKKNVAYLKNANP